MQVDAPPEDNDNTEEETHIVENPSLDLEAYASAYSGLAKLNRLKYIAEHCPSLRVEALKMGLSHVMNTYNVTLYKEFHKCLQDTVGYVFYLYMFCGIIIIEHRHTDRIVLTFST